MCREEPTSKTSCLLWTTVADVQLQGWTPQTSLPLSWPTQTITGYINFYTETFAPPKVVQQFSNHRFIQKSEKSKSSVSAFKSGDITNYELSTYSPERSRKAAKEEHSWLTEPHLNEAAPTRCGRVEKLLPLIDPAARHQQLRSLPSHMHCDSEFQSQSVTS